MSGIDVIDRQVEVDLLRRPTRPLRRGVASDLASPGQSTIGGLTRSYGMLATLGVQDQPYVSAAVVSAALARPAEIVLSIAQLFLILALVGDHRASERR
jgi:hypothetical protein